MAEIKRRNQSSKGNPKRLHKPNKNLPWKKVESREDFPPETTDRIVFYQSDYGPDIGFSGVVRHHMTKKEYPMKVLAWFLLEEAL